jgi:hypothetical protein
MISFRGVIRARTHQTLRLKINEPKTHHIIPANCACWKYRMQEI